MSNNRVLLVDDVDIRRERRQFSLESQHGYRITACKSVREAREHLSGGEFAAVITAATLGSSDAITLLRRISRNTAHSPAVLVLAKADELGPGDWYGHSAPPLTSAGYERLARGAGFDVLLDDDVTARTLPTYPARRRLYRESGAGEGVATLDRVERLATEGAWQYHVLAFRKRA